MSDKQANLREAVEASAKMIADEILLYSDGETRPHNEEVVRLLEKTPLFALLPPALAVGEALPALDAVFSRWDEYEAERDLICSYPGPGMEESLQRNSSTLCKEIRPLMDAAFKALAALADGGG